MISENAATAEMLGVEEIKDILLRFHADTASAWRHERDGIATFAARAVLALIGPILAEKERAERALEESQRVSEMHREKRHEEAARALAAEAALAAERERCARIVDEHARELMVYRDHHYVAKHLRSVAAAIRAQGE